MDRANTRLRGWDSPGWTSALILANDPEEFIAEPYAFTNLLFWTSKTGHQIYYSRYVRVTESCGARLLVAWPGKALAFDEDLPAAEVRSPARRH